MRFARPEVAGLWHDRLLGKLGYPLKHIDDFDYGQLQAMNFAAHFSELAEPEGIMSLNEFLEAYRTRCHLLLEIKNRDWEETARHRVKVRQTLDLVGATKGDTIMASSFNLDSLIYAQQYRPGFPLVYNFEKQQTIADAQRVLSEQSFLRGLCLPIKSLDQSMVRLLRDNGKLIAVYTCNSDAEISKALEFGVDILISDLPKKALQFRDR